MQVPFPELTELWLYSENTPLPIVPDLFSDGSAPRLQIFHLYAISFPGLPKLLLSATHLTHLVLGGIPHSECIFALLSDLSFLEVLSLDFVELESPPHWESTNLPPSKRSILPTLAKFRFDGDTSYLEELVTRIDTPRLYNWI